LSSLVASFNVRESNHSQCFIQHPKQKCHAPHRPATQLPINRASHLANTKILPLTDVVSPAKAKSQTAEGSPSLIPLPWPFPCRLAPTISTPLCTRVRNTASRQVNRAWLPSEPPSIGLHIESIWPSLKLYKAAKLHPRDIQGRCIPTTRIKIHAHFTNHTPHTGDTTPDKHIMAPSKKSRRHSAACCPWVRLQTVPL